VRTELNKDCACPEWLSAADVGRAVAGLVAGKDASEALVRLGGYASAQRPATESAA